MVNKGGRPMKYNNTKDLSDKINEYFKMCDETIINQDKIITKPYTISGLCLYLDITRETLDNYEDMEMFFDTIKRAKKRVENYVEEHSLSGDLNPTVSIFNLKNNFGWKDKQEIESLNTNINITEEDKELINTIKSRLDNEK